MSEDQRIGDQWLVLRAQADAEAFEAVVKRWHEVLWRHAYRLTRNRESAIADEALKQAAAVKPGDRFELVFKNLLETLFVERMKQNEGIFARFMNDRSFQRVVIGWLSSEAYKRLRTGAEA